MTDLAASRSSGDLGLTDGICREIILMNISLGCNVRIESLHLLCIGKRCEGHNIEDLRLSSGEHCRTMDSGNDINLGCQRADLCEQTAVRSLVILENHLADGLLLVLIDRIAQLSKVLLIVRKCFLHPVSDLCDSLLAGLLIIGEAGLFHLFRRDNLLHVLKHLLRNRDGIIFLLRLADFLADLVDEGNQLLVDRICLIDVVDHILLGDLICAGLDHHDTVCRGSNGQAKIALVPLLLARVDDNIAVDKAYLRGSARSGKRDIGNRGRNRGADHGKKLRSALRVNTEDHALQRDIIAHILREQRTHRTVDDAARQNCVLAGLSFSFVESSREFADGIELLGILHAQREEVHAFAGLFGLRCSAQNSGVTVVHQCASVCLLADTADIDRQCSAGKIH